MNTEKEEAMKEVDRGAADINVETDTDLALEAEMLSEGNSMEVDEPAETLTEEEKRRHIERLKPILEGVLLAAGDVVSIKRMQGLFDLHERPSAAMLAEALDAIKQGCEGRGFQLLEVASGWRFQVREDYASWVNRLWEEKPQKYSRALLETLALIAYRQPLTRGDIEEVRGVAVSSHIIKTLMEREWVKVVGHRDVPGRPALYATSRQFLDYFGLKSLDQLPTLGELKDIDSLNESLELSGENALLAEDAEYLAPAKANELENESHECAEDAVADDPALSENEELSADSSDGPVDNAYLDHDKQGAADV